MELHALDHAVQVVEFTHSFEVAFFFRHICKGSFTRNSRCRSLRFGDHLHTLRTHDIPHHYILIVLFQRRLGLFWTLQLEFFESQLFVHRLLTVLVNSFLEIGLAVSFVEFEEVLFLAFLSFLDSFNATAMRRLT